MIEAEASFTKRKPTQENLRAQFVSIYTGVVSWVGLLLIGLALTEPHKDPLGLITFIILAATAEVLSVELFTSSRGSRVSVAGIVVIASVLAFGPLSGVLVNVVCGLIPSIRSALSLKEEPKKQQASYWRRTAFNIGMLVISAAAAGFVYVFTGGKIGEADVFGNLGPMLAGVATGEFVNIALLVGVLSLQTGRKPGEIWKQNFQWIMPIGVLGTSVGSLALAMAYQMFSFTGLVVFFLPVLSIGYSFRLYVGNSKKYVNQLEEMNASLVESNLGLLETLGAIIDAYDVFTYGHSKQVAVYAEALAREMGLAKEMISMIVKAALVHDLGKIGITDSITSKPSPLTEDEIHKMRQHPIISADILRRTKGLQDLVPLVRHHHERWDGKGYPAGLAGEEIPLGARVITLADALEAMCSDRPYRRPMDFETVVGEIIGNAGTHFDPQVVTAFEALLHKKGREFFKNTAAGVDKELLMMQSKVEIHKRFLKKSMRSNLE